MCHQERKGIGRGEGGEEKKEREKGKGKGDERCLLVTQDAQSM